MSAARRAVVVVPARDEEERIGACLDALAEQEGLGPGAYSVIVVLDRCGDGTAAAVEAAAARWPQLRLETIEGPGRGAGAARALGMDLACERLEAEEIDDGLMATTDADTRVAPDWLRRQLDALAAGAEAVGGDVVLDPGEAGALPPGLAADRDADLRDRLALAAAQGPAEHPHFAGASLGLTPRAYRAAGGIEGLRSLEDRQLAERLVAAGVAVHRPSSVRVITSARADGRADRGLATDLRLGSWLRERTFDGSGYELGDLVAARTEAVAVVLPAREVAETIGPIVSALAPLQASGLFDELLVVDADSADDTAAAARRAGADAVSENDLAPELGPCLGKGDAMWRAARAVRSDVIVFLDADTVDFEPTFLTGLLGPLLGDSSLDLVKGSFRRPMRIGDELSADEGGRVTELVARPLLNLHFPLLTGFAQPLSGEIAIRRDLMLDLSVPVGYGVEIAMLIDALRQVGLDRLAQVDLGTRQNRHQSLAALGAMAAEVMVAVERRTGGPERGDRPDFTPRAAGGRLPERLLLSCAERPPSRPPAASRSPADRATALPD